jgi:NAD(P)H-hydrate epimerase
MRRDDLPAVTAKQMKEADRLTSGQFGITEAMMMENVARSALISLRQLLDGILTDRRVTVLSGKGNNGGDGLAIARHTVNAWAVVQVFLAEGHEYLSKASQVQLQILEQMKVPIEAYTKDRFESIKEIIHQSDVIVDALLGYSLEGSPRDSYAHLIRMANNAEARILAIDVPTGVAADTGMAFSPSIQAEITLALGLPKLGTVMKQAERYVGQLHVADIGLPVAVYELLELDVPPFFTQGTVVRVL